MKSLNNSGEYKAIYKNLLAAVEQGNRMDINGNHSQAIEKYQTAWAMLPDPIESWEESHWVASCIIEAYLNMKEPALAKSWCRILLKTMPSDIDVGSIVAVGRVCLEMGEKEEAYDFFDKAYNFGGKRSFQGYDAKYLKFYMSNLKKGE